MNFYGTLVIDQQTLDRVQVDVTDYGDVCLAFVRLEDIELRNFSGEVSPHDLAQAFRRWADQIDAATKELDGTAPELVGKNMEVAT